MVKVVGKFILQDRDVRKLTFEDYIYIYIYIYIYTHVCVCRTSTLTDIFVIFILIF